MLELESTLSLYHLPNLTVLFSITIIRIISLVELFDSVFTVFKAETLLKE